MSPNENVAGMRIAVHETRDEDLLSEGSHHVLHNGIAVKAVALDLLLVGDFDSIDPFSHEHSFPRKLVINVWNTDVVALQAAKPFFRTFCILSLNAEVNLLFEVALNGFCELQ